MYRIYLYTYIGDFYDVKGEFSIYHHEKGYVDNLETDAGKIILINLILL